MHLRLILINKSLNYFRSYDNIRLVDLSKVDKDVNNITDNFRYYNKLMYKKI